MKRSFVFTLASTVILLLSANAFASGERSAESPISYIVRVTTNAHTSCAHTDFYGPFDDEYGASLFVQIRGKRNAGGDYDILELWPDEETIGVRCVEPVVGPVVNINTATLEQLMWLPGITRRIATEIIAGRPYADARELDAKVPHLPTDPTGVLGLYVVTEGVTTATGQLVPGVF
jgi:hypothetical protein